MQRTSLKESRIPFHYAWIVAGVTFLVLIVTAGVRATPGVLMVPLEAEFGWSRAAISAAVAINIALFGLIGPFAASAMNRWGLRRLILAAIALLAISVALTTRMQQQWQMTLLWGICVGTGTGVTSMVLAAVVATRWFVDRREPPARGVARGLRCRCVRTMSGGYEPAFWIAGILCVLAGTAFLTVGRRSFSSAPATEAIVPAPA
jgi:MFS family permease